MGLAVSKARLPGLPSASDRLGPEQLVEIYRLMYLSRRMDDREIMLKRQQKIFSVSQAPVTKHFKWEPGWLFVWIRLVFPYYRDRALCWRLA